jgi:methylated-DNA-protein-cysteine methyltransferase-like protein
MTDFKQQVEKLVSSIPFGRVMTYGQIAALCSKPRAARIVGGIAHYGDDLLPWHRVVNARGGLASGYPGGRSSHKDHLEAEGIRVSEDYYLDLNSYLYVPKN